MTGAPRVTAATTPAGVAAHRKLALAALAVTFLVASALPAAPAAAATTTAQAGSGLLVTFAARVCPDYTDITANRARNDIQESLRDLGADTPYADGQAMDPAIEAAHQPACSPLPGWTFTLGTGYRTRAVSGPWGALSIVTGAYPTAITTQPSTPLLDQYGRPTGSSIEGATTIELTPAQAQQASRPSSLWAQGGTPADPILDVPFPGQYGFGALRCAIDDLNGDNVEWISFPSGSRHVFCFAYYVKPPPTSGTIVIRKQIQAPAGTAESFPFEGNVSFNAGGLFALAVPSGQTSAQETFIRAETSGGAEPWHAREVVPPNWRLSGLTCSSQTGASGTSTDIGSASVSISLASGDTVTCTFTDQLVPPDGGLLLRKVTHGATGRFGLAVTPAAGGAATSTSVQTAQEGLAADADSGPLSLAPGAYLVRESAPASSSGTWSLTAVECDGRQLPPSQPIETAVASGAGTVCTLTNTFVPRGRIALEKTTTGALATTGFVISPDSGEPGEIEQSATTVREGVPAPARGAPSDDLPLGRYLIQETTPEPSSGGSWELTSVRCNGEDVPFDDGQAAVTLTAASSAATCAFTNAFHAGAPQQPPPPPTSPDETASLSVTKHAAVQEVPLGGSVAYEVVVESHGPAPALDVVLDDQPSAPASLVLAHASHGSCGATLPLTCSLGTLAPGVKATVSVVLHPHRPGVLVNRAILGTSSVDPAFAGDVASAPVLVRSSPLAPSFTG